MKSKKFSWALTIFLSLLVLVVGAFAGFVGAYFVDKNNNEIFKSDIVYGNGLEIHFLELGNNNNGDCIYIRSGKTDIWLMLGQEPAALTQLIVI